MLWYRFSKNILLWKYWSSVKDMVCNYPCVPGICLVFVHVRHLPWVPTWGYQYLVSTYTNIEKYFSKQCIIDLEIASNMNNVLMLMVCVGFMIMFWYWRCVNIQLFLWRDTGVYDFMTYYRYSIQHQICSLIKLRIWE